MSERIAEKKKFKMPHIYVMLILIIIICSIATWVLPAGEFERMPNEAGRMIVVPGTYHEIEPTPIGPFKMVQAIYDGMVDAGPIVFFVFVSYASIGIIISSGAFNGLVAWLLKIFKGKARVMIIPIFIIVLGASSSTIGLFEEMMPFIPIFVGIAIAMGYDAIVGLAIVGLGCGLGYSGAVMNPFTVGMAQSVAELQPMSGSLYRIVCHLAMIVVASAYTMRYALKIQEDPTKSVVYGDKIERLAVDKDSIEKYPFGIREKLVLLVLVIGIGVIVYGTKVFGWYFGELSAVFMLMALAASIIMGWGPSTIAEKMGTGFSDIAVACIMIGIARGILMVLRGGGIIDTVVYGMSIPLAKLPAVLSANAMLVLQTLLNFIIPSGSGQAVTSMPIMAPLGDLVGVQRQVTVLAFQFGDGLSNLLWPTAQAALFAGVAGIKLEKWWKWFVPCYLLVFVTQMVLISVAVLIGYH